MIAMGKIQAGNVHSSVNKLHKHFHIPT